MARLVECVPNFSEGRDLEKVEKIVENFKNIEGVTLLDYSSDPDHNRS
ncbi:MAG: glutamate formiminotransferase, partial [Tissierellia bacterium]|nr:glutamate formiminotransferase [Tissierellia bacterium]